MTSEACSTVYSHLGRSRSRDRAESRARLDLPRPAASGLYPPVRLLTSQRSHSLLNADSAIH